MSLIDLHRVTRPPHSLPGGLRLGAVDLTVIDLRRSIAWYQQSLGLHLHHRDEDTAALGDGREKLVVLHEDPRARPAGRGTAGLYHFALLFPTREELARAGARLAAHRTPIEGASDHGYHEAIYLPETRTATASSWRGTAPVRTGPPTRTRPPAPRARSTSRRS